MRKPFAIIYAPQTKRHIRFIEQKYHSLIRDTIEEQLQFEPDVETKNRKPLEPPGIFDSEWELRFGQNNQFRVFYQTDKQVGEVHIIAIGIKERNRLFIEGEEIR
jgi:hypothetical protein